MQDTRIEELIVIVGSILIKYNRDNFIKLLSKITLSGEPKNFLSKESIINTTGILSLWNDNHSGGVFDKNRIEGFYKVYDSFEVLEYERLKKDVLIYIANILPDRQKPDRNKRTSPDDIDVIDMINNRIEDSIAYDVEFFDGFVLIHTISILRKKEFYQLSNLCSSVIREVTRYIKRDETELSEKLKKLRNIVREANDYVISPYIEYLHNVESVRLVDYEGGAGQQLPESEPSEEPETDAANYRFTVIKNGYLSGNIELSDNEFEQFDRDILPYITDVDGRKTSNPERWKNCSTRVTTSRGGNALIEYNGGKYLIGVIEAEIDGQGIKNRFWVKSYDGIKPNHNKKFFFLGKQNDTAERHKRHS